MAHAREQQTRDQAIWFRFPTDALSQVTDQVRLTSMFCGVVRVRPPFAYTATRDGLHLFLMTHGQRMFLDPLLKFGQARFPALLFVSSIEDDPLDVPVDLTRPFEARPNEHISFPGPEKRSPV